MQRLSKKLHRSPKPRLRILGAGAFQAARDVDFPPHSHSHWELVYYRSGTVDCLMRGKRHAGHAGLLWLTPPEVVHAERALTDYSNYYIALAGKAKRWPPFLDDDGDRSLGRVCQQIVIECSRKTPERERMLELLAEQLVYLLNRASSEKVLPRPVRTVVEAERLMEEKCEQRLGLRDVARAVKVSASTLRGHFQQVRGFSPRDYLQKARLDKAIGFLRTSTLKLEAIAELCGYDSASHLSRCVKKSTGKTPGQLRVR